MPETVTDFQAAWLKRNPPHCVNPDCPKTENGVTDSPPHGKGYCRKCYFLQRYYDKSQHAKCSACGLVRHIANKGEEKPLCPNCHQNKRREVCSVCGKEQRVAYRDAENRAVCRNCHKENCIVCNELKTVATRTANDEPICNGCKDADLTTHRRCMICKKVQRFVVVTKGGGFICEFCYKETCSVCGKKKSVKARNSEGKAICSYCFREECSSCHRMVRLNNRIDGKVLCRKCAREPCSVCGESKSVAIRKDDGGAVCYGCYFEHFAKRERCSVCGKNGIVAKRGNSGEPICRTCYPKQKKTD